LAGGTADDFSIPFSQQNLIIICQACKLGHQISGLHSESWVPNHSKSDG
jgi:hypothetical protein